MSHGLATATSLVLAFIACGACGTTAASNVEPAGRVAEPASPVPWACETVADCAGKPFRPNAEMCMRGERVRLQCRNHTCVQACAADAAQ